ncbi:helix-turn-helix domain-containing protein [Deinococcus planocerae]|uniref:helix-turn-helix domain-containing protein n=1 Tax=Deinococcus planocerae TaxID=1737569 RepID=UPI000C7F4556|nr:helix-turn-helix domain-containing protein [Deinococcus planocerae]
MTAPTVDPEALFLAWKAASVHAGGPLARYIETEGQHAAALDLPEAVWEAKARSPELGSLLGLLAGHIAAYEERAFPMPASPPHRLLAFLMEQQGVTVAALAQATGIGQEELDDLLSGQQDLTRRQMHTLAQALHVSPQVLL